MVISPNLQPEAWGDFSSFFTVRIWWENLEVKLTKMILGTSQWLSSLEFSSLSLVYTKPLATPQFQFQFCYPRTDFCVVFCEWASALVSCDFLDLSVGLPSFGGGSSLCDLTSLTDLGRVVFISVCSAFHLLRIEWQFLSSLHGRQETENLVLFSYLFWNSNIFFIFNTLFQILYYEIHYC